MALWGMTIDLDRCTGCQTCVLACKAENNIPPVPPAEAARGRTLAWLEVIPLEEPQAPERLRLLPRLCQHCDQPPCVRVCPVHATYRDREGTVAQIYPQCIGCRLCMAACPYQAKRFNWRAYQTPARGQNPDVSLRPKGVVEKCTFCHHRRQTAAEQARAERRPLRAGDYQPACVEACPAEALTFGDLADPESPVSRQARSPRAFRLHPELGTEPKVIYLSERRLSL